MADKGVVPEGMVAWAGGDSAPADWHWPLSVKLRDGSIIRNIPADDPRWAHTGGRQHRAQDIIAYTARANPLSLETSDLDPITPEEDAAAMGVIAALGFTRQAHDTVVRAIRDGLAKVGAVIVPAEPTEAMLHYLASSADPCMTYAAMITASKLREQPCLLCAGKCRKHSLGHPDQWEPEEGSVAAIARADAASIRVPIEPTDEMLSAGSEMIVGVKQSAVGTIHAKRVYRAMLSAHSIQSGGEGGDG